MKKTIYRVFVLLLLPAMILVNLAGLGIGNFAGLGSGNLAGLGIGNCTAYAGSGDYVTVRIEGNGRGTNGTSSGINTVLDSTIVYLGDLPATQTAYDAVYKVLSDAGLPGLEKSGGLITTIGGVGTSDNDYWRFSMNDASANQGLETQGLIHKDRIVLDITDGDYMSSSFNNAPHYSYFKVVSSNCAIDYGYPKAEIKLALYRLVYDNATWTSSSEPVGGVDIKGTGSWTPVTTDSENGIAQFTLWGNGTGAGTCNFDIYAVAADISRPYCKATMTYDGTNAPSVTISQPSANDTSLGILNLYFPGVSNPVNGLNYVNGSELTVGNGMSSVSISAIASAEASACNLVTVSAIYQPFGGVYSGSTDFDASGTQKGFELAVGENTFKLIVQNDSDKEIHTLIINRSAASADNTDSEATAVISGIRNYESYLATYYNDDWVLGMAAAGLTLTSSEQAKYLANVLNLAADSRTSVASKAKAAIALTALGIDARQVANKTGGMSINLISDVASYAGYVAPAYSAPFILSLYDLGNYQVPSNAAITRVSLIESILKAQAVNGSWYGEYGADATGMVLPALAPYYGMATETNGISAASCSSITAAVNNALAYLSSSQSLDGSFPGYGGSPNSNTMTTCITGINALGLNPNTDSRFVKSDRSAMQNLLAYKTSDNRLGYTNNTSSNDLACQQGLGALATFGNLTNGSGRSSNLYHFTKSVTQYLSWPEAVILNRPEADILTGIKVTAPTKTTYTQSAADTNYTIDTAGMTVIGIYNGNSSDTKNITPSACSISSINRAIAGTQTVTVAYQGYSETFTITVQNSDGTTPNLDTVSVVVKNGSTSIASADSVIIEQGVTTAMDVLKTVLNNANVKYVIKNNYYVSEINGLGEFGEGENSGWMYSINGITPPTTAAKDYKLSKGDRVIWYYSLDYTTDQSTKSWIGSTANNSENTTANVAKIEVAANIDKAGQATAKIAAGDVALSIANAIKAAKKDASGKSEPVKVIINIMGTENVNSLKTVIPQSAISEIISKADTLVINTQFAELTLDKKTLNGLPAQGGGDFSITAVRLKSADVQSWSESLKKETEGKPIFDFSMTCGGKDVSSFGGKVTISAPYTAKTDENTNGLIVYFVDEGGNAKTIKSSYYNNKTKSVVFLTNHFSKYALAYKTTNFNDVNNHWAKEYITFLSTRNIINGTKANTFAPNSKITRAQFVQILAKLSSDEIGKYATTGAATFTDVKQPAWYANAATWAYESGIAAGTLNNDGSSSFNPDAYITRQDMAVMLMRYIEKTATFTIVANEKVAAFSDEAKILDYAKGAVKKLQGAGLIGGKIDQSFAPLDPATRAESAKIIALLEVYKCSN